MNAFDVAVALIVDSDADVRAYYAQVVRAAGHLAVEAADGGEAFAQAAVSDLALAIVSQRITGAISARCICTRRRARGIPVIVMVDECEVSLEEWALATGCDVIVTNHAPPGVLSAKISAAIAGRP